MLRGFRSGQVPPPTRCSVSNAALGQCPNDPPPAKAALRELVLEVRRVDMSFSVSLTRPSASLGNCGASRRQPTLTRSMRARRASSARLNGWLYRFAHKGQTHEHCRTLGFILVVLDHVHLFWISFCICCVRSSNGHEGKRLPIGGLQRRHPAPASDSRWPHYSPRSNAKGNRPLQQPGQCQEPAGNLPR